MIESNYILYAVRQYQKLLKNKKHFWLQKIEDYNLTKQKYFEYIQLYKNKKKSSQTKFYMQLNSIRKGKKKKALLVSKNRGLQLNQAKILRIYPIV